MEHYTFGASTQIQREIFEKCKVLGKLTITLTMPIKREKHKRIQYLSSRYDHIF